MKNPLKTQEIFFKYLINTGGNTVFGKYFGFSSIKNFYDFRKNVPLFTYENIYPYIESMLKGHQNILWPNNISWFSKSSGTTNSKSKFLPVSLESFNDSHYKSGRYILSIYINNFPNSNLFFGKNISLSGFINSNTFNYNSRINFGDISALISKNLPFWWVGINIPEYFHQRN